MSSHAQASKVLVRGSSTSGLTIHRRNSKTGARLQPLSDEAPSVSKPPSSITGGSRTALLPKKESIMNTTPASTVGTKALPPPSRVAMVNNVPQFGQRPSSLATKRSSPKPETAPPVSITALLSNGSMKGLKGSKEKKEQSSITVYESTPPLQPKRNAFEEDDEVEDFQEKIPVVVNAKQATSTTTTTKANNTSANVTVASKTVQDTSNAKNSNGSQKKEEACTVSITRTPTKPSAAKSSVSSPIKNKFSSLALVPWPELTPAQLHILKGRTMEPRCEGEYLYSFPKSGVFCCVQCKSILAAACWKIRAEGGFAAFDRFCEDAVQMELSGFKRSNDETARVLITCTKCHGFLGELSEDGDTETRQCLRLNSLSIRYADIAFRGDRAPKSAKAGDEWEEGDYIPDVESEDEDFLLTDEEKLKKRVSAWAHHT